MQDSSMFSGKFWLAMVMAILLLILWDYFFLKDQREAENIKNQEIIKAENQQLKNINIEKKINDLPKREDILLKTPRIVINNDVVNGSLSLFDGVIDDISLKKYKNSLEYKSQNVRIFDLQNTQNAYFFKSGWFSESEQKEIFLDGLWKANALKLTPNNSITLTSNKNGLIFKKIISIDNSYLITIVDEVINKSNKAISLVPYNYILRHNDPQVEDLFISHEGFVGDVAGTLERIDYKDVLTKSYEYKTSGGFIGFTDKYWLSAIVLSSNEENVSFSSYKDSLGLNNYKVSSNGSVVRINPNDLYSITTKIFVGPKEYNVIKNYNTALNLSKFDDTIDFGWFFFFTKPMIKFLLWIHSLIGNFGLAILVFTIIIRLAILPIAYKSYVSMAKMKDLQPKMKSLKELYKSDMQRYNKELMDLYKKEQVNPLSGCLPILLQIPIFFSIYKVIFVSIEMRHAPFWGWIHDLSAMDNTNLFTLFGLLPWNTPDLLHIGVWPILMGLTMYIQQKLSTAQTLDKMQQRIMNMMPVFLTVVLAKFPVGLVIYWTWSNVLSIIQQYFINKKVHSDLLKRKK